MTQKMIVELHKTLQNKNPLIHNITNYVVMNNTANALLALGASPIMSHAREEVEDMVNIASALVINIGTLSEKWIESMILAIEKAKRSDKPFVLDPVGVGASTYRTETCRALIDSGYPTVIRGNASEIMALANHDVVTKGVDSTAEGNEAIQAAKMLTQQLHTTVVVSGKIDYVVSRNTITEIRNGHAFMPMVTGMGCTATAIVGAFLAIEKDAHAAATAAMSIMGIVGEMASEHSKGPASFQTSFIDTLYLITAQDIQNRLNIHTYES